MSTLSKRIGMILRYARTTQKYTLEQIADKLGKTKATLSRWEKGEREFNVSDLVKYLDAINMNDEQKEHISLLVVYCDDEDALKKTGISEDEIKEIFKD